MPCDVSCKYIYIGNHYSNYDHAMDLLECDNLNDRRNKLCENFAKKSVKHPKFTNWFCENSEAPPNISTRGNEKKVITKFKPVQTRTNGIMTLPYLI